MTATPLLRLLSRPVRILTAVCVTLLCIGVVATLQSVAPAPAHAGGVLLQPADATDPAIVDSEVAIISMSEGQEQIDLRLGISAITVDAGLIIPTPSPATVTNGNINDFMDIGNEMTPRSHIHDRWWAWPQSDEPDGVTSTTTPGPAITVLDEVVIGSIEATTVAAEDSAGLTAWLEAHGYGLGQEVTDLLPGYVERGWSFVALKLTGSQPLQGELSPIRLTFASDGLIYPLLLSRTTTSTLNVTLHILTGSRQEAIWLRGGEVEQTVTWASQVRIKDVKQRGLYLTTISMRFDDPSTSIRDDLRLRSAGTDDD